MRKGIFLFLFILVCSAYAQQKKIDSLLDLVHRFPSRDSIMVDRLNELSWFYGFSNAQDGLTIARKSIRLAKELKSDGKLATAYQREGYALKVLGRDSLALTAYDHSLFILRKLVKNDRIARALYNKGLVYFDLSDYSNSTELYQKAYSFFKKEKDSFLMGKMLNSIAINYMYESQYTKSLSNYLKAAAIYEKLKQTSSTEYASILSNIGLLYYRLEDYKRSLTYQKRALELFKNIGLEGLIANGLTNLGNLYEETGKPQQAMELYLEAYEIMEKIGNKLGVANALTNMGIVSLSQSDYPEAINYFNQTRPIYDSIGNSANLAIVYEKLGVAYLELGSLSSERSNFIIAQKNFKNSLVHALQAGTLNTQEEVWKYLATVNEKLGNYKEAYLASTKAGIIEDSINSVNRKAEIARLEANYEYTQRENLLKAENEKKQALGREEIKRHKLLKNIAIIGCSAIVLLLFIGVFIYTHNRDISAQKTEAEFQAKVADSELKALRSQLNPHFIFNALNSISDFIAHKEKASANEYLAKFAKIMRLTLENSEHREVTLKKDLELLAMYMELEALRLNHKFTYSIKVDPGIDIDNTLIPPFILQPIIENSIWHGISKKEGRGEIKIEIRKVNETIICSVDDNGIGRSGAAVFSTKQNKEKSMGLKITENRIKRINDLNNRKGGIAIIDKEQGVRVEVSLPEALAF